MICSWRTFAALVVFLATVSVVTEAVDASMREAVDAFYAERDGAPVFLAGPEGGFDVRADKAHALVRALKAAPEDGLDRRHYAVEALALRLREIDSADTVDHSVVRMLEDDLAYAYLRFSSDLASGRTDPQSVDSEVHIRPSEPDARGLLVRAAAAPDGQTLKAAIGELRPEGAEYRRLRQALDVYREIARRGGWTRMPSGETLRIGAEGPRVAVLREVLRERGDLAAGTNEHPDVYGPNLERAVRRFQARHGLTVDGITGPRTIEALNVPVEDRIRKILLNMERRRWMPDDPGRRHVFVNLADFALQVVDGEKTVIDMRVVVGTPYHRTPVFSDRMTYLEVNPYWNVPPSIAGSQILPEIREDPGYLVEQGFRVFEGWQEGARELDPWAIDWDEVPARRFPYKLRQDPGPMNALGRVKFMFPNRFAVYLHDTPARYLFDRTVRAFSRGCIRVERPLELAHLLLRLDGQDPGVVDRALETGDRTVIRLRNAVPVHLTYLTAWIDGDGTVHFRDDVYGRDARLASVLLRPDDARSEAFSPGFMPFGDDGILLADRQG